METLYSVSCGLDVHKRSVTACLRQQSGAGGRVVEECRDFLTTTAGLETLGDWLTQHGCTAAAMESTGVYWKPVYNLLEERVPVLLLVNAQHIKQVPGRKTDMTDAQWIARLLQAGLLAASFVPTAEIRDARDLTRYRKVLIRQRADECNRIQKLLETCNIKLASVATDVLGASGRRMLGRIAGGESDPEVLAELALGRLRGKIPQLRQALYGKVRPSQRWLLERQLQQIEHLDQAIAELDAKIDELMRPFSAVMTRLMTVPGISRRVAQVLIAETGPDMKQFGSAERLASWAGMCPGNHQSGGKRYSGKTRHGSPWLKAALMEAAWAAGKKKDSYFRAQYQRLARRRGKRRACVAVGHALLKVAYVLMADPNREYTDLGEAYFDRRDKDRLIRHHIRRLRELGINVPENQPSEAA